MAEEEIVPSPSGEDPKPQADQLLDFRVLINTHNLIGILDIVLMFFLGNPWIAFYDGEEVTRSLPFGLFRGRPDTSDAIGSFMNGGAGLADALICVTFVLWAAGFVLLFADLAYRWVFKHNTGRVLPTLYLAVGFLIWLIWNIASFLMTGGAGVSVSILAGLYILFALLAWAFAGPWGQKSIKTLFRDADETRDTGI